MTTETESRIDRAIARLRAASDAFEAASVELDAALAEVDAAGATSLEVLRQIEELLARHDSRSKERN